MSRLTVVLLIVAASLAIAYAGDMVDSCFEQDLRFNECRELSTLINNFRAELARNYESNVLECSSALAHIANDAAQRIRDNGDKPRPAIANNDEYKAELEAASNTFSLPQPFTNI